MRNIGCSIISAFPWGNTRSSCGGISVLKYAPSAGERKSRELHWAPCEGPEPHGIVFQVQQISHILSVQVLSQVGLLANFSSQVGLREGTDRLRDRGQGEGVNRAVRLFAQTTYADTT